LWNERISFIFDRFLKEFTNFDLLWKVVSRGRTWVRVGRIWHDLNESEVILKFLDLDSEGVFPVLVRKNELDL
jgi:hypothetical protein